MQETLKTKLVYTRGRRNGVHREKIFHTIVKGVKRAGAGERAGAEEGAGAESGTGTEAFPFLTKNICIYICNSSTQKSKY